MSPEDYADLQGDALWLLEQTQDFKPLPPGVWRRSIDPDTLDQDYEDGMASYTRAPELSMTEKPNVT